MPSKISNGASSTLRRAGRRSASGSGGGGAGAGAGSSMTTPQGNAIPPPSPAQLTQDALELLRQFLMYLDPPSARLLPIDEPPNAEVPIPISDWNVIYSTTQPTNVTSSIKVSSYPSSSKNLFCVQSVLPGVSTRQFWTLMAESGNRRLWDNTVQEGGNWRWLEEELGPNEAPLARSIAARIEYLRMGAIFMVAKARDMLLLSADVRLPPTADSPLRMVSSCRSEVDPTKPPVKGYTRWDLGVGGFMVEELRGTDAIRVTQLSDLGELASWVPNSVVKMVASTMVPRSLSLISKAALKIQPHEAILGDTAPAGASLRDEIVVKNHERWSRGRGLPGQIGKGPLQARATAATNDQSLSASTVTAVESTSTASSSHAQDSMRSSAAFTATNSASSSSSSPSSSSWKTPVNPNLLAPPLTLQRLSTRLHDLTPPNLSPSSHQARSVVSTDASSRGYGGGSTGGGDGEAASQQSSSRPPSHGGPSMRGHTNEGGNSDVDETVLVSDHAPDASSGPSQRASFAETQDDSGEDSLGQLRDARELDERLQRFSLAVRATSTDEAEGSGGADAAENAVADDEDEVDEAQSVLAEALSSSLQSPQLLPKLLPQSPHRRRRSSSANLTAGAASSPPRSSSSASGAMPDPRSSTRRRMEKEASELSAMLLAGSDALVTALAPGARGIEELASSSSGAPSDDEGDTSEVREQALRARSGEGQEQAMIDVPTTTAAAAVTPASTTSALPASLPSQVKAQPTRIPFKAWDPSSPPSSASSLVRPSMRRHASSNSSQPIVSTSSAHAMRSFSYSSRSSLAPPEVATASAGEIAPVGVIGKQQQGGGDGKRGQRSRPYALALGMMAMLWASSSSAKGQQQALIEARSGAGPAGDAQRRRHYDQRAPLLVEPGHDAQEDAAAASEATKDDPSPAVTAARRALMQRSVSNSSTTSSSSSSHHPPAATIIAPAPVTAAVAAAAALDTPTSTGGSALPPLPPPTTSSSSLITPTSTLPRHHTLPPLPLSSPTFGASSWKSTSSENTMTILPSPPASPRIPGEDDERRRLSRANYRGNWKLLTGDAGGGGEEM